MLIKKHDFSNAYLKIKREVLLRLLVRKLLFILTLAGLAITSSHAFADNIKVCISDIPGHITLNEQGVAQGDFVDLFLAIDREYEQGEIQIQTAKWKQCLLMASKGMVDVHFPTIKPYDEKPAQLPFDYFEPAIGSVSFMAYYNPNVKKGDICHVGAVIGLESYFNFPTVAFSSIAKAFTMIQSGQLCAFIVELDAGDLFLKTNQLQDKVSSVHYRTVPFYMAIPRGGQGERVQRLLSPAIKKLSESGELEQLAKAIHQTVADPIPSELDTTQCLFVPSK